MKKTLAMLCVLVMMLTLLPAASAAGAPSAADLKAIGSQIEYPKSSEYLSSYVYATVAAPGGHSVYCYGSADRKGSRYTVNDHEAVTVLAYRKDMACIIIDSQRRARWIKDEYLDYYGNPGLGDKGPGRRNEKTVRTGGYYIEPWEEGSTRYYKVSKRAKEIGAPTFYCEGRDVYENRYSGSDIRITFYRKYDGADLEQGLAFKQYLDETTKAKQHYTFLYYYPSEMGDYIEKLYIVEFDGLDLERINDYQVIWDRNPWVNSEGTELELVHFFYGSSLEKAFDLIRSEKCSAAVWYEIDPYIGYFAAGFRFTEGSDRHIVKRYCLEETW